jgi:hypothetical protein
VSISQCLAIYGVFLLTTKLTMDYHIIAGRVVAHKLTMDYHIIAGRVVAEAQAPFPWYRRKWAMPSAARILSFLLGMSSGPWPARWPSSTRANSLALP